MCKGREVCYEHHEHTVTERFPFHPRLLFAQRPFDSNATVFTRFMLQYKRNSK